MATFGPDPMMCPSSPGSPHDFGRPEDSHDDVLAPVTDDQLVRGCLEGGQEAWSALLDRYRNLIFSIPIKYGFSPEDASEIFQEVCLKLLSDLQRVREPKTLAAWLITVTSHECQRWRRKCVRQTMVNLNGESSCTEPVTGLPLNMIEDLQREQVLREALAELPERCRELVSMLFFTTPAVAYEDVAKRISVAKGSIGFIRGRCLKRLRRLLEEKGFA